MLCEMYAGGCWCSVLQTTVHAKHSTYYYLCNHMPLPHFVIFAHAQLFYDMKFEMYYGFDLALESVAIERKHDYSGKR